MSDIQGPPADVTFTMTITRAATGEVETYQMEGHILPEPTPVEGEQQCQQQ